MLEIQNSDNEYYQSGKIQLFNTPSTQTIGDTVTVKIDGTTQFNGYVSRKQQSIDKGKPVYTYQLIGKTYDLWRYVTDANALYSGSTSYIASSLVSAYCPTSISTAGIPHAGSGIVLTNDIDLTNKTVGDSLVELTKLDGYRFFLDNDDVVQYYKPETRSYDFTITEDDIISMNPVEEADEDIVNDVLIVGGSDYSTKTNVSSDHPTSKLFPSGVLVAQRFTAEDPRLSAVKLYLGRSTDPNQPGNLLFEIWENTELTLFEDNFDNYDYLDSDDTSYNMDLRNSNLELSFCSSLTEEQSSYSNTSGYNRGYVAQTFKFNQKVVLYSAWMWADHQSTNKHWNYIAPTGATGAPDLSNAIASTQIRVPGNAYFYEQNIILESGTTYAFIIHTPEDFPHYYGNHSDVYDKGHAFWSDNGSSWTKEPIDEKDWDFKIISKTYKYSSQILSKSYNNDVQYMKIDLTGVVSGNWIYISGTNDGGTTWKTLLNGQWIDFGSESSAGTRIKYKFSSNGYFTPRIGSATVSISDGSGGFEQELFSDEFNNSNLISSSVGTWITNGSLRLSGSSCGPTWQKPGVADNLDYTIESQSHNWSNPNNIRQPYGCSVYENFKSLTETTVVSFPEPVNIYRLYIKGHAYDNNYDPLPTTKGTFKYIWISGTWTGWRKVFDYGDNAYNWFTEGTGTFTPYFDSYYKNIKKVKIEFQVYTFNDWCDFCWQELLFYGFNNYSITGSIRSYTQKTVDYDTYYLKADVDIGRYQNCITISGSADSGSHWVKLENGNETKVNYPGKKCIVDLYIKPSSISTWTSNYSGATLENDTPIINSYTLTSYTVHGGGVPKSGSKIEWSDDISWGSGDVPYPPSYSAWKSYSDPKLSPDYFEGNNWWMVFDYAGGNTVEMLFDDMSTDHWISNGTYSATDHNYSLWHSPREYMQSGGIDVDADVVLLVLEFEHKWDPVGIYVSSNGYDYELIETTSRGPPMNSNPELYTVTIPDKYVNPGGKIGLKFINAGNNTAGVGYVKLYKDTSYWMYSYDPESSYSGKIAYSWDNGVHWSTNATAPNLVPDGNMTFQLGWKEGDITYRASNQTSIDLYGRHFKKINDSTINTYERAIARAEAEISGSEKLKQKGTITIDGRTDMSPNYRFSANLSNLGINNIWDVRSYTQRIDKNGFTTTINYGMPEFDFIHKLAKVEKQQESGD